MKKSLTSAAMPIVALALFMSAFAFTLGAKTTSVTSAAVAAPQVPQAWNPPVNVSQSAIYDNNASIGASRVNGAVTISWEQRNDPAASANFIKQASNTTFAGTFGVRTLSTTDYKASGNLKTASDSLGRRHVVWYEQSGSTTCNYYARIAADGTTSLKETVPGTCGLQRKATALAVGTDNTVHALFGTDNTNIYYYQRTDAGWTIQSERVLEGNRPNSLALGVTTNGTVIAAWIALSPGGNNDVYTGTRNASNRTWTIENISYSCCDGCSTNSKTYLPSLARDYSGGMRIAWADEQCDPRAEIRVTDLYYREWLPNTGWNNQPIVRVVRDPGEIYYNAITVEENGRAHIAFDDDTGRAFHNYEIRYVNGSGTNFTASESPFRTWAGNAYQKVPSLDHSPGRVHISFNSDREDPLKEVYYAYNTLGPSPTPTPSTLCPGERFLDVCPRDTFYTYIMNLVNLGVISGYSDNTFRPNNNLTRGQASKIVSLAANLPANLQGAPHFTDVPPDNTFYEYVEFSYNAGVIGGYPCGGIGEPCDTQRRAYFRPNNNITRGQLSKMTAQAFGFNEAVSGQTFTDVPPSNAFYVFIERMARRGIISGYTDGTFRPNTEVTRGQASKIIDGARLQPTATPLATHTPTITATFTSTPIATVTLAATLTIAPTLEPTLTIVPTLEPTLTSIIPTVTVTLQAGR